MAENSLADQSMLEIFRAEVETHSEALSNSLLALEQNPGDTSCIDGMMRAAHSIKGASRIVGVEPAVQVAHVLEDCFVAAQNNKLTIKPDDVDVMLRSVDLLCKISDDTRDPEIDTATLQAKHADVVKEMVGLLQGVLVGKTASKPAPKPSPSSSVPSAPAATKVDWSDSAVHHWRAHPLVGKQAAAASTVKQISKPVKHELQGPRELAGSANEEFRQALVRLALQKPNQVVFDFSKTKELDAVGLATLALLPDYLDRHQIKPSFMLSPELDLVLRACGLDKRFAIAEKLA